MQPVNLIVDDLGEIIGDYHDLACDVGEGFSGSTGSGNYRAKLFNANYIVS